MICEMQVPTASVTMEGNPALHRVRWAQSGREIAVGDSEGQVLIYDVGEVRVCLQRLLVAFPTRPKECTGLVEFSKSSHHLHRLPSWLESL